MSDSRKLKFLCFKLGERFFALDIMGIREILRILPVTKVPDAPETVLGIVNVRGELITVLDMRKIFSIVAEDPDRRDMRIILGGSGGVRFGILVDSVQEVVTVELTEIDPPPIEGDDATVIGVFKRQGDGQSDVVILLKLGALARMARGERMNAELPEAEEPGAPEVT